MTMFKFLRPKVPTPEQVAAKNREKDKRQADEYADVLVGRLHLHFGTTVREYRGQAKGVNFSLVQELAQLGYTREDFKKFFQRIDAVVKEFPGWAVFIGTSTDGNCLCYIGAPEDMTKLHETMEPLRQEDLVKA